jgi:hypothetical protein
MKDVSACDLLLAFRVCSNVARDVTAQIYLSYIEDTKQDSESQQQANKKRRKKRRTVHLSSPLQLGLPIVESFRRLRWSGS